jgi:signal transduction histidine kinase/CHASE3 domain sensor protein
MPGHPAGRSDSRWATPAGRTVSGRVTRIPAAFVLFSLLALLLAPLLLSARTESLRQGVVEPGHDARGEINEVLHAITRAEAAARGLLLTTDERFLAALREAHADERDAFHRLIPLASRLDPALGQQARALQARSEQATRARAALLQQLREGRVPAELLAQEEERHEALVRDAEAMKTALIGRAETARARAQQLRRAGTLLTIVLAFLALISAVVVLRIGRSYRLRAQEEAELRAAAFSLTEVTEAEDVLRRIAGIAARTDRGESSYVERLDLESREIEVVASVGSGAPPVGARAPYPGSLTEEAIHSGSPEVVADLSRETRPVTGILPASCARCAALVIPLVADRDAEGALVIVRPPGSRFSDREVEQRRAIGVLAALSLRKSVLLEQARDQNETLQRVMESRERLIRGFSHDLKNPLGAADGHAQLLADGIHGELTDRQRESVLRIRSGIGSALELIGSLIELARSEAGQLVMVVEPVDVAGVVRDMARIYQGVADSVGLRLEVAAGQDLPTIRSDHERIRQVLGNLLSNAIKYTPPGGTVRLFAERRSGRRTGDPSRWVTLSVQDTGPGISVEQQAHLFTEFRRLDPGASQGEGLGLAISDRIARLLGGEITVASEVGKGSTFTLWLPADRDRVRLAG